MIYLTFLTSNPFIYFSSSDFLFLSFFSARWIPQPRDRQKGIIIIIIIIFRFILIAWLSGVIISQMHFKGFDGWERPTAPMPNALRWLIWWSSQPAAPSAPHPQRRGQRERFGFFYSLHLYSPPLTVHPHPSVSINMHEHIHECRVKHVCAARINPGLLEVSLVSVCVCLCVSMQVGLPSTDHLSALR